MKRRKLKKENHLCNDSILRFRCAEVGSQVMDARSSRSRCVSRRYAPMRCGFASITCEPTSVHLNRKIEAYIIFIFFFMSVLVSPCFSFANSLDMIYQNKKGLEQIEEKDYPEAGAFFLNALSHDPFHPVLRLNLGLSYEAEEELEKALKEYMVVYNRSKPSSAEKFAALFNMARIFSQLGDVPGALELYQEALSINPLSLEVKTNIELLLKKQQTSPPPQQCDNPNDKPSSGQKLKPQDPQDLSGKDPQPKQPQSKKDQEKELSSEDIRKILEEISNQEKQIRSKQIEKEIKERDNEKNW